LKNFFKQASPRRQGLAASLATRGLNQVSPISLGKKQLTFCLEQMDPHSL